MDCSPTGSSVYEILQATILEGIAIPSPGDLPDLGMEPGSPVLHADFLLSEPPGKPIPPIHIIYTTKKRVCNGFVLLF